jgi:hypothetical protein
MLLCGNNYFSSVGSHGAVGYDHSECGWLLLPAGVLVVVSIKVKQDNIKIALREMGQGAPGSGQGQVVGSYKCGKGT